MNTPAHILSRLNVFTVTEFDAPTDKDRNAKARSWTRVGVAFPHKEGIGFNIQLNALPTNGSLVALPPDDDSVEDTEESAPPEPTRRDSKRRH
jgi:hypothetical protein